jgi:hypothetical protein
MAEKDILKELFLLSEALLKATLEEDWIAWERIAKQQSVLYKELENGSKGMLDRDQKERLQKIQALEDQIIQELINKKEETRQAILQLKAVRKAWSGYREGGKSRARRHLDIHY